MPAPLAKGLIIATSILIAAGVAFYENEQIRAWIENSRRKIVLAINNLTDGLQDQTPEEQERREAELARRRREHTIRTRQMDAVSRARDEGVAVDLDELAAIAIEENENARDADIAEGRVRSYSMQTFDDIVGGDGMLRDREITLGQTTGAIGSATSSTNGLRNRGVSGFTRGASFANPFDDEGHVLYDEEKDMMDAILESREMARKTSSTSVSHSVRDDGLPLLKSQEELDADIQEAIRRSLEGMSLESARPAASSMTISEDSPLEIPASNYEETRPQLQAAAPTSHPASSPSNSLYESYYYGPHPNLQNQQGSIADSFHSTRSTSNNNHTHPQPPPLIFLHDNDYEAPSPPGTATPTEDGYSIAGVSAAAPSDVGMLAELDSALDNVTTQPGSSHRFALEDDMMSESDSSDAFSMVGVSTPGDWTDVESVADEEVVNESAATVGTGSSRAA